MATLLLFVMTTSLVATVPSNTSMLTKCDPNLNSRQSFEFTAKGYLRSPANDMCIDATCDNENGCSPLPLRPCALQIPSFQWVYNNNNNFLSVVHNKTSCLDVSSGGVGPSVGVYRCDGQLGQRWSIHVNASMSTIQTMAPPLLRCLSNGIPPVGPPKDGVVTLNRITGLGVTYDGLGAISGGGGTSRLLADYPEEQQQQILDYLFKPNFGASLQILKVEIGGDTLTTDGSESSHMHDNTTIDLHAGYEWWLMKQAKLRNPDIKLYGLPWAFPGWVGDDPITGNATGSPFAFPEQTARYMLEWVKGAKTEHDLDIDWLGIWNESPSDATYVKQLRATLDEGGFSSTRIVAQDGGSEICTAIAADPEYAKAVDIIGLHYPSDFTSLDHCHATGKPVWASEESSSYDDLNGAACWARVVNSHYVLSGISASIMWNLLGAYYPGTSWFASSMFTAVEPWSGHYSKMPVVWATAHTTQFSKIGWRYLKTGMGSGELEQGGYYVTTVDPNSTDFSMHVVKISYDHAPCTRPALPASVSVVEPETVTFVLDKSMMMGKNITSLVCFRSNFETETAILFEEQPPVFVVGGKFSLNVAIGDYYTISTVTTASHGSFSDAVPASQPHFPLPYTNNFDSIEVSRQAKWWSQTMGSWEAHPDVTNSSNMVIRQMAQSKSLDNWPGELSHSPVTVLGMREWQDISISVSFKLPVLSASACVATRADWLWSNAICLCVGGSGRWNLTIGGPTLNSAGSEPPLIASGRVNTAPSVGTWHRLSLTTITTTASAQYDGESILSNVSIRDIDTGFAAMGTNDYYAVEYDDVEVVEAGGNWNPTPPLPSGCQATTTTTTTTTTIIITPATTTIAVHANIHNKNTTAAGAAHDTYHNNNNDNDNNIIISNNTTTTNNNTTTTNNATTTNNNTNNNNNFNYNNNATIISTDVDRSDHGDTLVGHPISARRCYPNGISPSDQDWLLLADWQLQHRASLLCAEASSLMVGATLTLQLCNFTARLQKFKNDYSNIYHHTVPIVLEAANLTLSASGSGDVSMQHQEWKPTPHDWNTWSMFYSTGQLRNQRNSDPSLGYPMCLSLCVDAKAEAV